MTVLLAVATFALFLTIGYVRTVGRAPQPTQVESLAVRLPRILSSHLSGFAFPKTSVNTPGMLGRRWKAGPGFEWGPTISPGSLQGRLTAFICPSAVN